MSNLPPGVHEGMIPGNRPEDLAEEKFWDELYGMLDEKHQKFVDDNDDMLEDIIMAARQLGYATGFQDRKMEEDLDRMFKEEEVCISCGKPVSEEWCPAPCDTDLRDSNNRVRREEPDAQG